VDEDGNAVELELSPGLSEVEIEEFGRTLPCPLPASVRELLAYCRGFSGLGVDLVDFTGRDCSYEQAEVFPHGLPIAGDGYGNFWVVDLDSDSREWAPIYFACHDAPVILFQSPSLEHFLEELIKMERPPHRSAIDDVHEDRLFDVWRKNPGVMSHEQCLHSADPALAAFAGQLDPAFQIIDLRKGEIGSGFSWGRYGPQTIIKRFGALPLFAYCPPPRQSLFKRLFG